MRNLGIVLDQTLSMKQHITHVCKSALMHLRNIRYLKPYLSADALAIVSRFGLDGLVLSWFRSYLNERKQCISIKQAIADAV